MGHNTKSETPNVMPQNAGMQHTNFTQLFCLLGGFIENEIKFLDHSSVLPKNEPRLSYTRLLVIVTDKSFQMGQ